MQSIIAFVLLTLPAADAYPRAGLLVEPAELAKNPSAFLVLDCRGQEAYQAGHVPGAVNLNPIEWAKQFQDGKDVAGWCKRLGALGIKPDAKVVVYDDASNKDAARVWWILKFWGVQDVRLLHGMWTGWKTGNFPVSTEPVTPRTVTFLARPQTERLATKQDILNSLQKKEFDVVDARSEGEHYGRTKLARRNGCIPGATNLNWEQLIDQKTQRFKSAVELKKLFDQHHIDLAKPQAVHCQSGGRSSVMNFAMELMGATNVRNYHASWAEWGNSAETPVDIPK